MGSALASKLGVHAGDTITLAGASGTKDLAVTGVYASGDDDDKTLYAPLADVQDLTGHAGQVERIEVKALTTPENELSRKAAANPELLSRADWETWYCTAYPSSIAYQIEEVGSVRGVRGLHVLTNIPLSSGGTGQSGRSGAGEKHAT